MEKTDKIPLWVFLAFSSFSKRNGALVLTWVCIIFSVYCIPWSLVYSEPEWLARVFVIDDWSWFAMMLPISAWYWLSLRWMDKNSAWQGVA
jgi:hypothetical protein